MISARLNQVGGVDEITLAPRLAGERAWPGQGVPAIDPDLQGSALDGSQPCPQACVPHRFGAPGLARDARRRENAELARADGETAP